MALAWRTFLRFEAADCQPEGVKNFQNFLADSTLHRMFVVGSYRLFVALDGERIVGMGTLRGSDHVSLLFVEEAYQRQGIGRALLRQMGRQLVTEGRALRLTVNAAPYGVAFYRRMGFRDLSPQERKDGIVYTPMEFVFSGTAVAF